MGNTSSRQIRSFEIISLKLIKYIFDFELTFNHRKGNMVFLLFVLLQRKSYLQG